MSTSQTSVVEAQPIPLTQLHRDQPTKDVETASTIEDPLGSDMVHREPATPFFKLVVAGYSFFCAGVDPLSQKISISNDGSLGPLIPYILSTWNITTGQIAIIYATTFAGWFIAALTNPILTAHLTLGQLLFVGAAFQLIAQCLRPWSSLPLFCVTFFLQALGMAYQDSHSNTFVSSLHNVPHRWLSFIHACYALGCFVGPLIATAIANSPNSMGIEGWRRVYLVLVGINFANQVGVTAAFKDTLWSRLKVAVPGAGGSGGGQKRNRTAIRDTADVLKVRALWLLSMFYFFELGAWMTAGGWVVEFLTTVRGGDLANMGYVPTGYYGGLLAGRLFLAEPTYRLGERRMLLIYSVICVCLQLVFWLQPNIVGSAVALSLMGFFFGPFFATGMSVASKLFPKESQTTALGFIFVLAQAGGALFPSITGLIATGAGVAVLQPIVLALIIAGGVCWWLVPKVPSRTE
ncbi:putative mfs transporter protein [Eutypa lata UCREL1]|uniref:Putative mfs transporter protein n=1 Tax=Eutypa lata (strain UCR-EL1) TaxID=1287681 RepID=M7TNT3_EUTLA|nr:putative mfs transporter protein [Eutypa lata UCREL1]